MEYVSHTTLHYKQPLTTIFVKLSSNIEQLLFTDHSEKTKRQPIVINESHIEVKTCHAGFGTKRQSIIPNNNKTPHIILFLTHLTSIERNINSIKSIQKKIQEDKKSSSRKSF